MNDAERAKILPILSKAANTTRIVMVCNGDQDKEEVIAIWTGGAPSRSIRTYRNIGLASLARLREVAIRGEANGTLKTKDDRTTFFVGKAR